MKKTIAHIAFLVACMAGIIFLLLPFLQTTPPATTQLNAAQPQISSSNPLAVVANRLRSLFGTPSKESRAQLLAARDGYRFVTPTRQNQTVLTQAPQVPTAKAVTPPLQTSQDPAFENSSVKVPPVDSAEYGEASFQTDDGEWVLIRQVPPKSSSPGMHEVNVHENPYDRYVKQERARRFGPPVRQPALPDSRWVRLLRPIQHFFGLQEAHPVGNSPLAWIRENNSAHTTGDSGEANTSSDFSASRSARGPWAGITPSQWANMTETERQHEKERRSTAEFIELLSGTRAAEQAAAIGAEAKYPNPKDEDKRENYRQRLTEENKQKIKEGLLAAMQQKAQGQPKVDELGQIVGCGNASLPKSVCYPDPPHMEGGLFSPAEVAALQEQSRQKFLEITRYVMPNDLPLLPVLGPTSPETIENMSAPGLFVYEQNSNSECFWIPNQIQPNEQLREAFQLANTNLVTDPANIYASYKDKFVQEQLEKAQKEQAKNGTAPVDLDQIRQQAEKQFTQEAPAWIPVTGEQLKQIYQTHTLAAANPNHPQKNIPLAVLYVTNPAYAEQMYHILGDSPIFGYAEKPLTAVVSAAPQSSPAQQDKQTVLDTGKSIPPSLADNVKTAFAVMEGVTQQSVSEGTRAGFNRGITQFNQSGQSWNDMLNAVKNRNTPQSQPGKK